MFRLISLREVAPFVMAFASPTLCEPAAPDARDAVWSFGFGSNMNVEFVRHKKGYTVLDHAPAVVKGYRMAFATGGFECVEPSFATTFRGGADDEVRSHCNDRSTNSRSRQRDVVESSKRV